MVQMQECLGHISNARLHYTSCIILRQHVLFINMVFFERTKNVHVYHCNSGLLESIIPLYDKRKIYLGSIVFGQLRGNDKEYTSKKDSVTVSVGETFLFYPFHASYYGFRLAVPTA